MAISVQDVRDLILLLSEHPEWRVEFERALRGEQLLSLPEIVRELAEAQKRTETRLEQLTEAQRRTEARISELAEAQKRTEDALAQLIKRVEALSEDTAWLKKDMADVKGDLLELKYLERVPSYLSQLVRRGRVVPRSEWVSRVQDAEDKELYTKKEVVDLLALDLVARGRRRDDDAETYLAVEISWTIHDDDVQRAARRADLLRRQYPLVIPVAAGQGFSPNTFLKARELQVELVVNGQTLHPE